MPHSHNIIDKDNHFIINPVTRKIQPETHEKNKLVEGDHNSEKYTFEVPKLIEGHDMSQCNIVQIHYLNVSSDKSKKVEDVYEVDDLGVLENKENTLAFTWTIKEPATRYNGLLSFAITFKCTTNDTVDYAWHTEIYSGITIGKGMNNAESIIIEYSDILEKWKEELFSVDGRIETATRKSLEDIGKAKNESLLSIAQHGTVQVSNEEPTDPNVDLYINPDETVTFSVPEINDDTVSDEDTWSSAKINREFKSVSDKQTDIYKETAELKEDLAENSNYQNSFNDSFFNYETHSKNYFDYDTAEIGKVINNNGEIVVYSNSVVSAFIVIPTNSINLNVLANYSGLNRYVTPSGLKVAYYEADGTFISIFTTNYIDGINNFLIPSNAKLMRIQTPYTELGTQTSAYGSGTLMIMFDTAERPTAYIPCSADITGKLKESALPVLIPTKTSELTNDSGFVSESADYKGLIWCVMGDSWSDNANDYATKRYYDWVADKTGLAIEERAVSGSGFARGGANAFNSVSERIPVNSNLVTIYGSFNDLGADVGLPLGLETDDTTSSLAGCMNVTFRNILARCIDAYIICFSPSPWVANMPTDTTSREYVDMLKKVAERNGVMYVDMFTTTALRPNDESFRKKYYNTDGVHPNDEGHKWLYPIFLSAIKSVLPTI